MNSTRYNLYKSPLLKWKFMTKTDKRGSQRACRWDWPSTCIRALVVETARAQAPLHRCFDGICFKGQTTESDPHGSSNLKNWHSLSTSGVSTSWSLLPDNPSSRPFWPTDDIECAHNIVNRLFSGLSLLSFASFHQAVPVVDQNIGVPLFWSGFAGRSSVTDCTIRITCFTNVAALPSLCLPQYSQLRLPKPHGDLHCSACHSRPNFSSTCSSTTQKARELPFIDGFQKKDWDIVVLRFKWWEKYFQQGMCCGSTIDTLIANHGQHEKSVRTAVNPEKKDHWSQNLLPQTTAVLCLLAKDQRRMPISDFCCLNSGRFSLSLHFAHD